ncbi:MAG: DNA mismatch repair endonuclease MutL [Prevotella sp.]|nr:DNA mismatch repair endonuclease MutL [Prevotella sp.]
MSDVIQLLPDSVANQIAAGEVIQRPASVVKELMENSLDAGARDIDVVVTDAGRTAIRVIDNGRGMSETDARLCFERHATSKIRQAADLFTLQTMGFRGEALPSIAAVAQVELQTRTAEEDVGTRLTLAASHVTAQEPCGCPVGCNFLVENLFYNVPARRKFLKSNATELNNILQAFERIVLVYPDIHFTLSSDGNELRQLRAGTLKQRIVDICGRNMAQQLLPIEVQTSLVTINGFVGRPESARKKGAQQFFFVNGRYMRHPYFHRAVLNAFERLLPQGTQPHYFIYLTVPAAEIDVNIHPTKTEIKFENEQPVFQILMAAVRDALGRFCDMTALDFDQAGAPDIPAFDPTRHADLPQPRYNADYNPFRPAHQTDGADGSNSGGSDTTGGSAHAESPFALPPHSNKVPDGWERLFPDPEPKYADTADTAKTDAATRPAERSMQHYQYRGQYILTAVAQGLMVTDQHRADLRIRYEQYQRLMAVKGSATQRMLFPEVIEFRPSEALIMQQLLPQLEDIGFDLTDLGQGSFALSGIPAGIDAPNEVRLVRDIIDEAMSHGKDVRQQVVDIIATAMARTTAIPVGQMLSNDDMERIVSALMACQNVNYTPDGKPISTILPDDTLTEGLKG